MSFLNQDPHEYMRARKAQRRAERQSQQATATDTASRGDMSPDDAFLADLRDGGVCCCDEDDTSGWVDDTADRIRTALINAGWTEPESHHTNA